MQGICQYTILYRIYTYIPLIQLKATSMRNSLGPHATI